MCLKGIYILHIYICTCIYIYTSLCFQKISKSGDSVKESDGRKEQDRIHSFSQVLPAVTEVV